MNTTAPNPAKKSRWLDWEPKARILADSAQGEPTKTTESVFAVSVGATPAQSPKIEARPDPAELGWCSKGIPWAEWKAAALNRLFQEQGTSGEPGRITAATVRHGERNAKGREL